VESGAQLREQYESKCEVLRDFGPDVEHLISELLLAKGIRVHSVTHRIKTRDSLQRKISEKDAQYEGINDIHDLLGLRIITFFPDEVDLVAAVIEAEFAIDAENSVDKRALLDPDRFGYLSMHYVAELNEQRAHLAEHARSTGVKFEIQIRSILQHAWAEIEHDLGYHTAGAIPATIRRRFSRLAGLLEIADDEFQALREASLHYQSEVEEEIGKDPESVQIDQDSIAALVRNNQVVADLDKSVADALGTFLVSEAPHSPTSGATASALHYLGFASVSDIEDALAEKGDLIRAFAARWAKRTPTKTFDGVYPGISLFYLAYVAVADSGSEEFVRGYLVKSNIGPAPGNDLSALAREVLQVVEVARRDLGSGPAP